MALAFTWGASFLFIKVGLEGLSPLQLVLGRLVTGAVILGVLSVITRQRLPRDPIVWAHLAVVAVLLCVIPFLLFSWAELHIASGLASVYNSTTPLMASGATLLMLPEERPTKARLVGLFAGFAGIVVVLGPWHGLGNSQLLPQFACLGACLSYGLGFVYLRRFVSVRGLTAISIATVQVGLGAIMMLVLVPWMTTKPVHLTLSVAICVLTLGAFGTGIAYIWSTNIVASWGATNAAMVTYVIPLVGVLLGLLVLSESVTWNEPLGAALVLFGIAVSQNRITGVFHWLDDLFRRQTMTE